MLGAIIGDIVGSIYEFNNHKSKDFLLFGEFSTFTDDTLCTIAVADCLMAGGDPGKYLRMWGQKYWKLGYGNHYRRWLKRDDLGPYENYGNGATMRVSPAVFLATRLEQARQQAIRVTEVTHNHPEGIKGALATAAAIWMAFENIAPETIRVHIFDTYSYDMNRTCDTIRPGYEFDESCQETVPEAIICALEGVGVAADYALAAQYFRRAAERGYASGQGHLGWCYLNGEGVDRDIAEGMLWLARAAEQGDAAASRMIGRVLLEGIGVERNATEASKWFLDAAEKGDATGQYELALLYADGRGLQQNDKVALQWMEKAAAQGDESASIWLQAQTSPEASI